MGQVICPACGHVNRAEARFCHKCGAALQIAAPPSCTVPRRPGAARSRSAGNRVGWVALAVAAMSVLLNLILLVGLLQVRATALQVVEEGLATIDNLERQGLAFDFPISQTVNINQYLPVKQDLAFPVNETLQINTVVNVSPEIPGVGRQTFGIPINTTVPISKVVHVPISETFHLSMPLSISMTLPISLPPDQPPLKDWLPAARQKLEKARRELGGK